MTLEDWADLLAEPTTWLSIGDEDRDGARAAVVGLQDGVLTKQVWLLDPERVEA